MSRLEQRELTLAYGDGEPVISDLTHQIRDQRITGIIGPNASGKSTLLRACARLLRPAGGHVILDGKAIHELPTREVAKRLGLLAQQPEAPDAVSVEDLVRRGRYPHQAFLSTGTPEDRIAVNRAIELANIGQLRDRLVDELSGGQRQRAWIAMALAQETDIILLDEPTTYLDLAHRREVLLLMHRLNRQEKRTIVAVLHDVNDAADICDDLVAVRAGKVFASGNAEEVLNPGTLERIFGVDCELVDRGKGARPFVVSRSRTDGDRQRAHNRKNPAVESGPAVRTLDLTAGYPGRTVLRSVSVEIPRGEITVIIGPNACGKSTLLRSIARLLPAQSGAVRIETKSSPEGTRNPSTIADGMRRKEFARHLSLLEQGTSLPRDISVEDLVTIGRYPYQIWYSQWSRTDRRIIESAIKLVSVEELRDRPVGSLSGGQLRRAMLAMALAQEADIMLLDEPTTFLDLAHQGEVLDLVDEIHRNDGRTIVIVLHDLWQAMRYAHHLIVMENGQVVEAGSPEELAKSDIIDRVFGVRLTRATDSRDGRPLLVPEPAHRNA